MPPGTGICHQVNLEYLSRVVFATDDGQAYCDTLVGTDSHTTMVNGLGVLGWGVGGIEAEAAMLGQPLSHAPATGRRLPAHRRTAGRHHRHRPGPHHHRTCCANTAWWGSSSSSTGPAWRRCPSANRATIGNMSPEYGATCAIFPIDEVTLDYLRFTGRDDKHVDLVEAYAKEQGMFHVVGGVEPVYSETIELDLSTVVPSIAGPARPQDRVTLAGAGASYRSSLGREPRSGPATAADGSTATVEDGAVVVAAITSCTNTSNPQVMVAAGLVAKRAVERGLVPKPWVKTTLAPGSRVVMDYLDRAGLTEPLAAIGFDLVGYGCTTCIGNSGPSSPGVSEAVHEHDLSVASVLSGNRNFEGRIHPDVRMNYLASPPLVVAYALAGTMDIDLTTDPLGTDADGQPVLLSDLWPSPEEVTEAIRSSLTSEMFRRRYGAVFDGDDRWGAVETAAGNTFSWDRDSTYVLRPTFLEGLAMEPAPVTEVEGARVLAQLGDSVTTDHISPAGNISPTTPAGQYLSEQGRRASGTSTPTGPGGATTRSWCGAPSPTSACATSWLPARRAASPSTCPTESRPPSTRPPCATPRTTCPWSCWPVRSTARDRRRDWAAKGTALLGVRAVIAESFERIHRSNLIGMGVLPLQYAEGQNAASLGLTGHEVFAVTGLEPLNDGVTPKTVAVRAVDGDRVVEFDARLRIDTPMEAEYYRNGGILPYMLRQMAG